MALVLTCRDEHDVAKIVEALAVAAERARACDDPVGERLYLRLADRIGDALEEATEGTPSLAQRVAEAREAWLAHQERRRLLARRRLGTEQKK